MKHLKLLFRSLIKNDACLTGGKYYPWWVAVIFFILSTAISLVPTIVSLYTVDAGVTITQAAFETDKGFDQALKAMAIDNIDLTFYNQHTVENFNEQLDAEGEPIKAYAKLTTDWQNVDDQGVKMPYVIKQKVITTYEKVETEKDGNKVTTITKEEKEIDIFKLYVLDDVVAADMSKKVNAVLQGLNPYVLDEQEGIDKNKNNVSFAIFGKESFVWFKYNSNRNASIEEGYSPVGQFSGTYRDIASVKSLLELSQPTLTETVNKTAVFLNEGYNEIKLNNAAIQIGIYTAINAGIILLMGFILWLMTRGKNNPFRCYKFIETMKISAWTSFTPAILALIFGFIMGGNSMAGFMFVLMFGVRSMWLAMKNLRPTATVSK